ncbi:hypothetical protein [Pseudarthrobacter sp. efr-133-R2A-89]|nr:hypothetical protein [Pseudarthrobacter sp. efr-133-R2A-89]
MDPIMPLPGAVRYGRMALADISPAGARRRRGAGAAGDQLRFQRLQGFGG